MKTDRARGGARLGVGVLVAAVLAAFTVLLAGQSAHAAYPESVCKYTVVPQQVVGGKPVTVTGTSTVSRSWKFRLDDNPGAEGARKVTRAAFTPQTATGSGVSFSHTFSTPKVDKTTTLYVHCFCDGGGEQIIPVVLTAAGGSGTGGPGGGGQGTNPPDHNGILPGTGGPALSILLIAVALMLVGLGFLDASSRRRRKNPWSRPTW